MTKNFGARRTEVGTKWYGAAGKPSRDRRHSWPEPRGGAIRRTELGRRAESLSRPRHRHLADGSRRPPIRSRPTGRCTSENEQEPIKHASMCTPTHRHPAPTASPVDLQWRYPTPFPRNLFRDQRAARRQADLIIDAYAQTLTASGERVSAPATADRSPHRRRRSLT